MRLIIFFKDDFLLLLDFLLLRKILSLQNYVNLLFSYVIFYNYFYCTIDCFISAFPSLDNFSYVSQKKKNVYTNKINKEPEKICDIKFNDEKSKSEKNEYK